MAKHITPKIKTIELEYRNRKYSIEYFIRDGRKETILMVHGLGGAKENYWESTKCQALKDYCLISFDNPGTGASTYYEDDLLSVDDLVAITSDFITKLKLKQFVLVGTSMGGLTTLLYLKNEGTANVMAYINIEGNLMPEDCMFSSKVVQHTQEHFVSHVFDQTIKDMKRNGNAGYHIIANNLELNTNRIAYYHYSFQTVEYSSTGELLQQYKELNIPRLFIYGEKNRGLSYLAELEKSNLPLKMINDSDHFVFYDNPKGLYDSMAEFIGRH